MARLGAQQKLPPVHMPLLNRVFATITLLAI
jgi:hypothetical protein